MESKQIKIEPFYELPLEEENPYGKDILDDLNALLTNCTKYIVNPDFEKITKAYYFCVDGHRHIKRESGEPYYTHPLKVSLSLMKDFSVHDTASIIAALLHDTIEDVEGITIELVESKFGKDVARIVDGVTKIKGTMTRQMDKAATYGKLFLALVKDIRVIIIKLADRLDNMRTLFYLRDEKQKAIAYETLNFYTPFAQRLGLTKIKKNFEDLSLYFIDKRAFNNIHESLEQKRNVFINYIKNFLAQINQKLNERNVAHVLTIEHKHVYEIFTMIEQGKPLEEIDNFYSMVITLKTNDYSEAYRAYGIIANVFGPVSSLDDYIARPKINLYRALHSTHFGPGRKLIEVIIRTEEMDRIVERGIIEYAFPNKVSKPSGGKPSGGEPLALDEAEVVEWVDWMQDVIHTGEKDAIQKIWGSIKKNLYEDDITIHIKDAEGMHPEQSRLESYVLPIGACPIDLAFAISENLALRCISVKVNDVVKSLDYELKNNDYVEIITSPKSEPSPEWQNFVITNKAVVKLHNYFKDYKSEKITYKVADKDIIKLRVKAEDRKGLLNDIRAEIGIENIRRVYLFTSNSEFEGLFHIQFDNNYSINALFTKLLSVKGIRGIERIDVDS
ncbi:HD domain-containing protein [Bacteroidota bacterium]